jgi:protein-disulfide isomerase
VPPLRTGLPGIRQLQERLGDQLAFVFRNFPVTEVHPRADSVAQALEAAAAQGYFWEMHDQFYEHQHELEDWTWNDTLRAWAWTLSSGRRTWGT